MHDVQQASRPGQRMHGVEVQLAGADGQMQHGVAAGRRHAQERRSAGREDDRVVWQPGAAGILSQAPPGSRR